MRTEEIALSRIAENENNPRTISVVKFKKLVKSAKSAKAAKAANKSDGLSQDEDRARQRDILRPSIYRNRWVWHRRQRYGII